MGRKRVWPPQPKVHKGRERVWWMGNWHDLGPAGLPEAKAEYGRRLAAWAADPHAAAGRAGDLLLVELFAAYLASDAAPRDARPLAQAKLAATLLAELHLSTAADAFGPVDLAAWQKWLCGLRNADGPKAGLQRFNVTTVHHLIGWVKRVFKWGVATGRLAADRWQALLAVGPPNPDDVRPARLVDPADPAAVRAAVPFLRPPVRALVLLEWLTGARPSELCGLKPGDVLRSGVVHLPGAGRHDLDAEGVWVVPLAKHKTARKAKPRWLTLGPDAQAVLAPFLDRPADAYCFSPAEADADLRAEQRADRADRHGGSGGSRKPPKPTARRFNPRYNAKAYYHAVQRACDRAFPPPAHLAKQPGETKARWKDRLGEAGRKELKAWQQAHRWFPYMLRHLCASEVKAAFGVDGVQALLGHHTRTMAEHYGGASFKLAAAAAARSAEPPLGNPSSR